MRCQNCGTEFEGNFCPNCGIPSQPNNVIISVPPPRKKSIGWIILWLTLIFIIGIIVTYANGAANKKYSSKDNTEQKTNNTQIESKEEAENLTSQLQVVEYLLNNSDIGNNDHAYLEVKNNSKYDLCISANVKFYDKEKNLIGSGEDIIYSVAPETEVLLDIHNDDHFDSISYDIYASKSPYKSISNDYTVSIEKQKDKAFITLTNNGENSTMSRYTILPILFLKNGKPIGSSTAMFTDLTPGRSLTDEVSFYGRDFDEAKVYMNDLYALK